MVIVARIIRTSTAPPVRRGIRAAGVAATCMLLAGSWWAFNSSQPPSHEGREWTAPGQGALLNEARAPNAEPALGAGNARAGATAGTTVALERIEIAPSGAVAAILSVNGGMPARHSLGDSLGPGVRLARVNLDSVAVERRGMLELLALPRDAEPLRRERIQTTQVQHQSATLPRPPTSAVAQVLDSTPTPGVVSASPDRANPVRSGVDRMIAAEAMSVSTP